MNNTDTITVKFHGNNTATIYAHTPAVLDALRGHEALRHTMTAASRKDGIATGGVLFIDDVGAFLGDINSLLDHIRHIEQEAII